MATATLTTKGQVTIPKSIRDRLKLQSGDIVEFIEMSDGRIELVARTRSFADLVGLLPGARKGVAQEEMDAAIRSAVVGG